MANKFDQFMQRCEQGLHSVVRWESAQSRWGFFASLFAIVLFCWSLVPTIITIMGGAKMTPMQIFWSVIFGISGLVGLIFLIMFVLYVRRHPPTDPIETELHNISQTLKEVKDELAKLKIRIDDDDKSKRRTTKIE